ncbi:MAG: SAM-dependent methyltransferase [Candidatus Anammoxibacter sp.]
MTQKNHQKVVNYYDQSWLGYKAFWGSGRNLGIHYGFHDENTKTHNDRVINMNKHLALLLGLDKLSHDDELLILDAGCGVGGTSIFLAGHYPQSNFYGITLADKQIGLAKGYAKQRGVNEKVTFFKKDYLSNGFHDETFDAVFALESMCYAADKHAFVKEARRVLKPGGKLVVLGFFCTDTAFESSLEEKYRVWCDGWAIPYLETDTNFKNFLTIEDFNNISFNDITQNVMPSSIRMYRLMKIFLPVAIFLEKIGLRTTTNINDTLAAMVQRNLLESGSLIYAEFCATK